MACLRQTESPCILNFVDVYHAYERILMTVAYKLLALLIPLLCALVDNLNLYFMTNCGNLLKCLQNHAAL